MTAADKYNRFATGYLAAEASVEDDDIGACRMLAFISPSKKLTEDYCKNEFVGVHVVDCNDISEYRININDICIENVYKSE